MKSLFRKLRGIIGTGLTWAGGWGAAFLALWAVFGMTFDNLAEAVFTGMGFGLVAGSSFAVILTIAERQRALNQLSLWRVGLWGGIGGMALVLSVVALVAGNGAPLGQVLTFYLPQLVIFGTLGAGFASGSVALAQREDKKLLEGWDLEALRLEGD